MENAMRLVEISKQRLQDLRDNGWDSLLTEVASFCSMHDIAIHDMNEKFRGKRREVEQTNDAYFRIELFCDILDKQLMELNNRFSVKIFELLCFVGCLNPRDSFYAFNKASLVNYARLYPSDFSTTDLVILENQLETYIIDMRSSVEFSDIGGIGELAQKMVKTKRDRIFHCLQASCFGINFACCDRYGREDFFSSLKIIKNRLGTRMTKKRLNSCMVANIETEIWDEISNETIMQRFQNMKF